MKKQPILFFAMFFIHLQYMVAQNPANVSGCSIWKKQTTSKIVTDKKETNFIDFLNFNDFIGEADSLLADMGLEGELQIASFHPQFQFAGTDVDDVSNYTIRAPYPIVHVLREASIDRAVASFPDASVIYERNIKTLEKLGVSGWAGLFNAPQKPIA